ncbi:MAG: ribulose-phosphate 3-epimerase [Holosporaceae bacterium]|jgi:ribulose-phosphate 3-epimerase|nr:ribulose-phosphate 3-epimerase [Holosporaceae bacterium]
MFICPSILSANPTKLGDELISVEKAGADSIHWDVMDGTFVDAITFGHHIVAAHRKLSHLRFDVHLMVENPDRHLENFAQAGADVIIVHAEACWHLHRTLGDIKSLGKKAGVALNPATSIDDIAYCADLLDMVTVMTVNPGRAGQIFIEFQLKKIVELKKNLPPSVEICVDGGINDATIANCLQCGATSFVSGSCIFKSTDYSEAIKKLRKSIFS